MVTVPRYPGRDSEYGGGDGEPQRMPDGSLLDLPGIASATGVRARILRQVGIADVDMSAPELVGAADTGLDVSKMSFAQQEAYAADLALSASRAAERERLRDRTNGYADDTDQYAGDGVS